MRFAQIVPDIATRELSGSFEYLVHNELLESCHVGSTVLITFSHRLALGYVVGLSDEPTSGIDPERMQAVRQILTNSAFDKTSAELASWIATEYACPLSQAMRLLLPPGQKPRVKKRDDGSWELVREVSGPVDVRWVRLLKAGETFEPARNASKQRAVLEALRAGPMRTSELSATIPGASAALKALERKGILAIEERRELRNPEATSLSSAQSARPAELTAGQREALGAIDAACSAGSGDVVLIDGVTGSGKTEVYLSAIERVRKQGKSALVLVPEISLTAQTVGRFRSRFGNEVAVLHSRLSVQERYDQWDMLRSGKAQVVVGARSALFAPLTNLGLIVIDEEHETSYKQGSAPRYHAREVAAWLARARGCALVLGSATPSLESLSRCREGSWQGARWTQVRMLERPGASELPAVRIVDMTRQFAQGNRSIFSAPLIHALEQTVERGEKAVLLLNRRGFATFLMCRECGCVPECPHCTTALTYHERSQELACHSCGRSWATLAFPNPATSCPNCGSRYMGAFGVGTERVEDELRMLLGERADIIRMDADSTKTKGAHQRLLERFDAASCAVLVGTQMIAKGLDFPEVTLVGVINADTTLKLPDFRAAEKTYNLLEQVAGRAGRGARAGQVIVQTYWAQHPAIQAVCRHNRELFLEHELADRRAAAYPPFTRLANVVVSGRDEQAVRQATADLAAELRRRTQGRVGWELLGPADCVKARLKDRVRRHVMLKAPLDAALGEFIGASVRHIGARPGVSIACDIDPYDML